MNKDIAFQNFTAALGALMASGLDDLKPAMQKHVVQAIDEGGAVIALVSCSPVSVAALLTYHDDRPSLELFRIDAGGQVGEVAH